jgi:two-component system sensor histidine kinase YesM
VENAQGSADVSVRLYVRDDKLYAHERINFYPLSTFEADVGSAPASASEFRALSVLTLEGGWPVPREAVSHLQMIRSAYRLSRVIGALAVDIQQEALLGTLERLDLPGGGEAFLLDGKGGVYWQGGNGIPPALEARDFDTNGEAVAFAGSDTLLGFRLAPSNWMLSAHIPSSDVRASALAGRAWLFYLMGVAALYTAALFLAAALLARGVVRRVDTLVRVFDATGAPPGAQTPDSGLFRQLDNSLAQARRLVAALFQQMRTQRQSRLQLLQEQINPNFLYNTLDTLQWLVRGGSHPGTDAIPAADLERRQRQCAAVGRGPAGAGIHGHPTAAVPGCVRDFFRRGCGHAGLPCAEDDPAATAGERGAVRVPQRTPPT